MYNVVITDTNLGDGSHEREALGGGHRVAAHQARTEDEVLAVAAEADALLTQWAPITRRVLEGLPRLRAVVRYGIGLDTIDLAAAADLGVQVGNVDDYCLAEVADHAAASIYARNRRLTEGSRGYSSRGWTTEGIARPRPPAEDPVGIAGFGRIGRSLAVRVRALGFPVHVWDPLVEDMPDDVTVWPTLPELAAAVRHLSLHLPSTAETRGIAGRDVLAALGPDGHLVNTARGALVDEAALLDVLDSGELGFASLDVLSSEPPEDVSARVADHPRVLVTPHIAYLSTRSLPRLRVRAAEKVRELLDRTPAREGA
ncbi:C-terminal binding protein [Actinomadura sp. 1N219]|uniref:C-terminal binding protein n=1 Tax=Actinomadura sp. 1N219 TaxID=3375152 RepID=UPI0037A7FCDC